ncbi:hypothetical protein ABPG74_020648 [Tetrahymena malaccensis]
MKEKLIKEEKQIDESIVQELQSIVYKYRRHVQKQFNYLDDSNFKSMKQKDPESFQNEHSMSKFPGDVEDAKKKKKNYTIYEIYLNQRNKKIDWLFFNFYQESYLIEKYGMGVPLFFTMMKMTIAVLLILFLANLYTGLNQFNVCNSDQCYSFIGGGLGIIDIVNLPSDFMISFSFASWLIFSYIFKFYINRICEQDDENRHDYVSKSNQIILKYFQKGLSQEQIEQQLTEKFYEYIEKEQIGFYSNDMRITLANVTPITNFYKISQEIKKTNKLYMKIIKLMISLDQEIMKPQQAQAKKSQVFGSINKVDSINFNQNQNSIHNQNIINSKNEIDQRNENKEQIEQQRFQLNEQREQNINDLNLIQHDQACLLNQNDDQMLEVDKQGLKIDQQRSYQADQQKYENSQQIQEIVEQMQKNNEQEQEIDGLKIFEANQYTQEHQIKINKSILQQKEEKYQMDDLEFNDQLSISSSDDYRLQIVDIFYCQQLLRKDDKKIKKLIKLLQKYQKQKQDLQKEYISKKTLSSSYIVKCNTIQQKNLLLIFLKPPSPLKSFFQKAKYIFRGKYSTYSLDRYYPQGSTHLNINWQTIGIELQYKLKKQAIVSILGLAQFFISYQFLLYLYSYKVENDENQENVTQQYLKKALFALTLTIFYLLSEKLYDFYAHHMITSMDSKRILLYMQNLFFFYSLYYIILPLVTVFAYGYIQLDHVYSTDQFSPFTEVRPFQVFVTNFLVAASLFSAKSIFPVKLIKKKIIQAYYLKSQRYLKKTQYELNKIFRRQKFRLEDCTLSLFNLLVITIPFTFCLPILLIIPIFYLFIMYFAFKYQYLMVLRPRYYCKSINQKTSKRFANYIQRISFFSYIFFTSNLFIFISGLVFYLVYSIVEIVIIFFIKHNFRQKQSSRFDFINNMVGHFQVEKKTELNTQLSQAVDQYQYFSQSASQSSIQSRVFYYNQQQLYSNQQSDQLSQGDSQFKMQARSDTQFNTKQNKKFHYSFMLQYQKYKYIQDQSKLFHCQKY